VVLRGGRDVGFAERRGRPRDVAYPVRVAGESADVVVGVCGGVVRPQLDQVVGAAGDEPAERRLGCACRGERGARELARGEGGAPGDGVDAHAVGGEDGVLEGVVLEAEDADAAVGAGGGQVAAGLGRGPGDQVDGGGVQGELVDALPLVLRLLAPDQDAAVVGGRGEDGAVFGVGPGDAPDGAFVAVGVVLEGCVCELVVCDGVVHLPFECFCQAVLVAFNLEDLDGLVRGACCQSSAVVVEDSIVLLSFAVSQSSCMRSRRDGRFAVGRTYDHVIVTGV
jgi:hypothetical protein